MNSIILTISAAGIGYLLGSLSFARIVTTIVEPGRRIDGLRIRLSDSELSFESNVVSATSVWQELGAKYGCLTSILDMLKAAIPTLAFHMLYPEAPYYLVAAGMTVVGHIWPIFYHFKGGRGMSPILGGMLAIDWLGVILSQLVASLIGVPLKNIPISVGGGLALMIPWLAFRTREIGPVLYAVAMNALFWYAIRPEIESYNKIKREGHLDALAASDSWRLTRQKGSERSPSTQSTFLTRIQRWLSPNKREKPPSEPKSG